MKKVFLIGLVSSLSLYGLSLDDTIAKALQTNTQLQKIKLETQQSIEAKKAKKVQRYGKINLLSSFDRYNTARTLAPLAPMDIASSPTGAYTIPTAQDILSVGINYNVVLFNGYAQQNSYKISDILEKSAQIKHKLAKEELIYNVRSLYISLLALQKQLKAQKQYTKAQKDLTKQIEYSYKLGKKSYLDTLKAKNSYQASLYYEAKILSNIDILKSTLTTLMGGFAFDKAEDIQIDINQSVQNNEDLTNLKRYKLAILKGEAAKKKVNMQKSSFYPIVDFSVYYGYNYGPNATTNIFPANNQTYLEKGDWNSQNIWQAGIHLKWNIYDFGGKNALLEKEKLAKLEALLNVKDTKLDIQKKLKVAYSKLELAKTSYFSSKTELELLNEIAKVEQIKYENDAATITDLLDARAKQKVAYAKMISSKYEYQKAKYYINYILEKGLK